MAPLPTVNSSSSDILVMSPSSVALESTLTTATASLPLPIVIIFLILTCLYILIPRIFNWRYPCQSVGPLLVLGQDIERLIFENTRTVIVNESARARNRELGLLMRHLRILHVRVKALKAKSRAEPPRSSVLAWAVFQWTMVKEIDECYVALMTLDAEVQVKLERSEGAESISKAVSTNVCVVARNRAKP
ncbi:hypothetical protein Moror_2583 [Moniliophthora roreri MCA 2997]|uniref:Uncharacterized protein n=1 Tax=Moniliophthora roreri (strain MCA 2997) TaxID=1381753 RepID=V2YIK7_MONRO|nr:hypothetical protein Moror_2583 [Moniliophthora roreri MCA 2997]KAI3619172.1 hypothetical protein WG66_013014 [Moniliophthora roreri]